MNARNFSIKLQNNGYSQIETGIAGINAYMKNSKGQKHIVAVLNCMANCQFSGMQINSIGNNLGSVYGTDQILFIAFTFDAYNTRIALNGDHSHWIYNEESQMLEIFDDQPGTFFGVNHLFEYKNTNVNSYLFTVNNLLVAANIIVFIIMEIIGDTTSNSFLYYHGALFPTAVLDGGHEYYRYFTSMFMHSGISHLFNNMLVLFFIGDNLERAVGRIKYLIIYLGSGLIGGIVSQIYYYQTTSNIVLCVGASGAIFGVVGALIYILIVNKGRAEDLTLTRILIFVGLSIYMGITSTGVSVSAHIGGLVGGFILAALLYRKRGYRT